MALLDPNRAWALFMSDPADFIAMFAAVAVPAFGCAWWLRHFIGKERISTLEERLRFAKDKYDTSTMEIQRLTAYSSRLESDLAKLQAASPSPQLDAAIATSALVTSTVTSLSTANNALGVVLTAKNLTTSPPELGRPEITTPSAE
jgi:hypothetical protein